MRVPLDIAASIAEVSKPTIRQWVKRGHINRYDDGYDVAELLHWIDQTRPRDEHGRYVARSATLPSSRQIVA